MRKSTLLSVFQAAIFLALVVIGATMGYALYQNDAAVAVTNASPNTEAAASHRDRPEGYARGKTVWNDNGCGSCHNKNMLDKATGPALAGVTDRWAAEPRAHLYDWIRNSVALAESGTSARAAEVVNWSGTAMSRYPSLSDDDIEGLLAYIEGQYGG